MHSIQSDTRDKIIKVYQPTQIKYRSMEKQVSDDTFSFTYKIKFENLAFIEMVRFVAHLWEETTQLQ